MTSIDEINELTFDIKALILTAVLAVVLFLSEPVFKKNPLDFNLYLGVRFSVGKK